MTATALVHKLNNRPRPPAISTAMNAVTKNVGIGKPMEARMVDDCRKAKSFPAPDATKKNAIKQRAVVNIYPLTSRDSPASLGVLCLVGQLPRQYGPGRAGMVE